MGGDGGSFCNRSEQVKLKKIQAKWVTNPDSIRKDLYSRCALTKNLLQLPIVACGMGNLYTKESVLEHIVEPVNKDPAYSHLRSLKHVVDVTVVAETSKDSQALIFTCPVSGRTLAGAYKFLVMRACGCMVAQEALTKLGSEDKCVSCSTPYPMAEEKEEYSAYIPLYPDLVVKDLLLDKIIKERKAQRGVMMAAKAAKKKAKKEAAAAASSSIHLKEEEEQKPQEPLTKEELKVEKKRLKKQKRREEKAISRLEEERKTKKTKLAAEQAHDPRAKYDPRFKSKVFASIFLPVGHKGRTDTQFLCGVSTKAISSGFIT